MIDRPPPLLRQRLSEVEKLLVAKKPWPAFLRVGSEALSEWEDCPDAVQDALEWMATTTGGLLDLASVGPLTPVCQAFKALIEAAGGAMEAEENLRALISWCSFLIGVFMKLGTTEGTLSNGPVRKCLQDFGLTASQLAKRAKTSGTRRKWKALLYHRKDTAEIAKFEDKLRKIWTDIGFLAALDVRETQRGLLPPKLKPMATIPSGALSLPEYHVERTSILEKFVSKLTASGASPGSASPPHMLLGMGGAGKTVLASSVIRHENVRKHFRQGIFWVRVGQGGKDQLHALFEGLARQVGTAHTANPHGVPHTFDSLDAVVQHLTAVARSASPRLVVLDDVWEREVVDTLAPTGLVLLVTTRDGSVVGGLGGARADVGDMTEDVALNLLVRASGTVGSPGKKARAAMQQVSLSGGTICFPNYCSSVPVAMGMPGVERLQTGTTDKLVEYSVKTPTTQYEYEQQQERQAEIDKKIRNSAIVVPKLA